MASLRDPGRAAMEAEELARAELNAAQARRQVQARRARERALAGSETARRELAADYAAVNAVERRRAKPVTPTNQT